MNWLPLLYNRDWPQINAKAGDPTGTLISNDHKWLIEPHGEDYRLRGRTEESLIESNYKYIIGTLEDLKSYDLQTLLVNRV